MWLYVYFGRQSLVFFNIKIQIIINPIPKKGERKFIVDLFFVYVAKANNIFI